MRVKEESSDDDATPNSRTDGKATSEGVREGGRVLMACMAISETCNRSAIYGDGNAIWLSNGGKKMPRKCG